MEKGDPKQNNHHKQITTTMPSLSNSKVDLVMVQVSGAGFLTKDLHQNLLERSCSPSWQLAIPTRQAVTNSLQVCHSICSNANSKGLFCGEWREERRF